MKYTLYCLLALTLLVSCADKTSLSTREQLFYLTNDGVSIETLEQITDLDIANISRVVLKNKLVSATDSLTIASVYNYYIANHNLEPLALNAHKKQVPLEYQDDRNILIEKYYNFELENNILFNSSIKDSVKYIVNAQITSFIDEEFDFWSSLCNMCANICRSDEYNTKKWQGLIDQYFGDIILTTKIQNSLSNYQNNIDRQRLNGICRITNTTLPELQLQNIYDSVKIKAIIITPDIMNDHIDRSILIEIVSNTDVIVPIVLFVLTLVGIGLTPWTSVWGLLMSLLLLIIGLGLSFCNDAKLESKLEDETSKYIEGTNISIEEKLNANTVKYYEALFNINSNISSNN